MTANLPALIEPLTPADCDLRAYRTMPLDVGRLRDSRMANHDNAEVFRAAILLWCASWHEVPAASLPNDDAQLARIAGFGRAKSEWLALREEALAGFVLCKDGRLYHRVVAEMAVEAWAKRLVFLARSAAANKVRHKAPSRRREGALKGTNGRERKGTEGKSSSPPSGGSEPRRGTRLSPSWFASAEDRAFAEERGFVGDELTDLEISFRNYWCSKSKDAARIDWPRTWQNWVIKERRYLDERKSGAGGGRGERDPARRGGMLGAVMEARRARR